MKILMGGAFVGRFLINLVLQGSLLDLSSTSSLVKSTEKSRKNKRLNLSQFYFGNMLFCCDNFKL